MNQPSFCNHSKLHLIPALRGRPQAEALIKGSGDFPHISGMARFYQTNEGVIVYAEVCGLPQEEGGCGWRVFGFHIHEGADCGGNEEDPFANALSHFNPNGCKHPYHGGDLPPLFGNGGLAVAAFLTNRFCAEDVIGRTVIIHDHPDDFTSQPSGGSGTKIACGEIRRGRESC